MTLLKSEVYLELAQSANMALCFSAHFCGTPLLHSTAVRYPSSKQRPSRGGHSCPFRSLRRSLTLRARNSKPTSLWSVRSRGPICGRSRCRRMTESPAASVHLQGSHMRQDAARSQWHAMLYRRRLVKTRWCVRLWLAIEFDHSIQFEHTLAGTV
jgi:hypothetical protein